ncbi:MAG: hypothetical protein HY875_17170 [Chloroflexi bacterium]|nr:hypothetical protein [Chloroflexota bacterium]
MNPSDPAAGLGTAATYPFVSALTQRRSRRFAKGMTLNGGPLAYTSTEPPEPLTDAEEAALAFAAVGITGYALGELAYDTGNVPDAGSGNVMSQFYARTAASGDSIHADSLFVMNDTGTWLVRRPRELSPEECARMAADAASGDILSFYGEARVQISDTRIDVERAIPFVPAFNNYSANRPGTTYFLPVHHMSAFYINVLLTAFNEEFGYYLVDDTSRFQPAGVKRFARSKGGHLYDSPAAGRTIPIGVLDTWMHEFAAIEQGAILQNLGLMTQALGLGGFAHFAHHPDAWFKALNFRMQHDTFTKSVGMSAPMRLLVKLMRRDMDVVVPVGLEKGGEVLLRPFAPPYYKNMEEAVLAYVDWKYGPHGTLKDIGGRSAFKDPAGVAAGIPRCSEKALAATIAYCTYVYERFGRFPATNGPFRTVLAYQAHHLDPAFYARFYKEDALSETQRAHSH